MIEEMLPSSYPARYTFRVLTKAVATSRDRVRMIIESIVGEVPDHAVKERPSNKGNYWSLHVTCVLASEEQRRDVYLKLKADDVVLMTL